MMKSQSENVLHMCSECSKGFKRKGDLTRHFKLHLGLREFPCVFPGCGREFAQKSAMQTHMNIHTGEQPYQCQFESCGRKFGDKSSLSRHERERHTNLVFLCMFSDCMSIIKRRSAFVAHCRSEHNYNPPADIQPVDRSMLNRKSNATRGASLVKSEDDADDFQWSEDEEPYLPPSQQYSSSMQGRPRLSALSIPSGRMSFPMSMHQNRQSFSPNMPSASVRDRGSPYPRPLLPPLPVVSRPMVVDSNRYVSAPQNNRYHPSSVQTTPALSAHSMSSPSPSLSSLSPISPGNGHLVGPSSHYGHSRSCSDSHMRRSYSPDVPVSRDYHPYLQSDTYSDSSFLHGRQAASYSPSSRTSYSPPGYSRSQLSSAMNYRREDTFTHPY